MQSVIYTECHLQALQAECQYVDCHYAQCHYVECHGAICSTLENYMKIPKLLAIILSLKTSELQRTGKLQVTSHKSQVTSYKL